MASLYDLFKLAVPPQTVNPYNSGRAVRQPPAPIPPPQLHVHIHPHGHAKSLRHPQAKKYRAAKTFGRMVLVPMPEHLVKDYQSGRAVRLDQNTAMNLALQHAVQALPQHPGTPAPTMPAFAGQQGLPLPFGAQQGPLPGAMPGMHPPGMMASGFVSPQPGMMPRNLLPGGPVPFGARMPG